MRLSQSQREVLAQRGYRDFVERLAAHLRAAFPAEVARFDDAALRAAIQDVVTKSEERGFQTELEIASMAEYLLVLGLDLTGEHAMTILQSVDLSPGTKLKRLGDVAFHERTEGVLRAEDTL